MKARKIQISISTVTLLRGIVVGDAVPVNWNGNLPTEWTTRESRQEGRENVGGNARWSRRLSTVHHRVHRSRARLYRVTK